MVLLAYKKQNKPQKQFQNSLSARINFSFYYYYMKPLYLY